MFWFTQLMCYNVYMPLLILGFHMTSQALLKLVSAMLVSLGVKFILVIGHFYSEASLLSLSYFANYMNIQKEKKNDKSTRHSSKGILVLSEYAKSLQRRVQEIYSL